MLSEENFAQVSSQNEGGSEKCGHLGSEKITEEEFEYQAKVLSKQSVRQLVTSEAYERLMTVKGTDPANWNWQLHDKQEGFFPTNEDDKLDGAFPNNCGADEFNLDKQLSKVEEDLKKEARANNNAIQRAIQGNIQPVTTTTTSKQTSKITSETNLQRRTTRGGKI